MLMDMVGILYLLNTGSYTLLMSLIRTLTESVAPSVLSNPSSVDTNLHFDTFVILSISSSVRRRSPSGTSSNAWRGPFGPSSVPRMPF